MVRQIQNQYISHEPAGAGGRARTWLENSFGTGNGINTISSGLEGAWTTTAKWSNDYFDHLFGFEWELTKSLLEHQWKPVNNGGVNSPRCS
jgi:catalase-peroxidase